MQHLRLDRLLARAHDVLGVTPDDTLGDHKQIHRRLHSLLHGRLRSHLQLGGGFHLGGPAHS